MREYRGLTNDAIIFPAGAFPAQHRYGGECWNFKACGQRMYGYARVNRYADPAPVVRRLGGGASDSIDDVTVVWVAHRGALDETYVVGWFSNATVFNRYLDRPDAETIADEMGTAGLDIAAGQEELQYFVSARKEDARLLSEDERTFRVPTGRGWMASQFLLFYPDRGAAHQRFKSRVLEYITAWTHTEAGSPLATRLSADDLADRHSPEGEQVLVTHRVRERDSQLVKRAKKRFKRTHGRLFCEACEFDFHSRYGALGTDYIEAHHVTPLSKGPRRAEPTDLMMLCANCHRIVHRQIGRTGRSLTRAETLDIAT